MFIKYFSLFILIILLSSHQSFGQHLSNNSKISGLRTTMDKKKHIILLGASIGRAWDIESLPSRIKNNDYIFEYIQGGGFEKTKKLREILSSKDKQIDAVLLKQCAAYFPGNLEQLKRLMALWINECQKENVMPIPTTVVPVTRLHSFKKILIDIIKRRKFFQQGNLFKHNRNKAVLDYNDWIRDYCEQNGLSYLDLEAAVRYSEKNRFLREDLAGVDGLHLNNKAYQILDQIVIPTLEMVAWE